jgi:SOS-response transcriptional repressor LexA
MSRINVDDRHLDRLRDHYARYGALPSYAGISAVVGFQAKTPAVKLAQRLKEKGFLQTAPGGRLVPTAQFFERPLLSSPVRAGIPTEVVTEVAEERMTLDSYLIESPSKTVLVRVKGDSMRDAGVFEGDLAVVERAEAAQSGQFVVAVVDDEFTLKELRFEGKQPVLVPHNEAYPTIRPAGGLEIFGVVRGVVRRYRSAALRRRQR